MFNMTTALKNVQKCLFRKGFFVSIPYNSNKSNILANTPLYFTPTFTSVCK